MKKVIIEAVNAVAMHHFGKRSLDIGDKYFLKHEPTNSYDKNAVAIYKDDQKVGYLRREHAKFISCLYNEKLVESTVLLKPKFEPVVRNHRLGPEQRCNVGFYCVEENKPRILELIESSPFICRMP